MAGSKMKMTPLPLRLSGTFIITYGSSSTGLELPSGRLSSNRRLAMRAAFLPLALANRLFAPQPTLPFSRLPAPAPRARLPRDEFQ